MGLLQLRAAETKMTDEWTHLAELIKQNDEKNQ